MNDKQFNKFMEAITKSISKEEPKMIPKENNLVKIKYFYRDELRDLKKSIEGLIVNYATLSIQIKDTRTYRPQKNFYKGHPQKRYRWERNEGLKYGKCEEAGHIARKCISEKEYPYKNPKKNNQTKTISFCEIEKDNDDEVYIVNNITLKKPRTENLEPYKEDEYSDSRDTFDKFDYEEEEFDELKKENES
ncbi:1281_t:CDS:2 [Gigaspora margarita]|uniref:1281_t:CDS:1 n=1 Tax=Gigaspora margarita TaxID=4874 RepID=A0ABN7V2D6_GIGMA|nr:1281_t:CDS:2 [Gigaspora margarita]